MTKTMGIGLNQVRYRQGVILSPYVNALGTGSVLLIFASIRNPSSRAVDLQSFIADPDPAVFLNADPDPVA